MRTHLLALLACLVGLAPLASAQSEALFSPYEDCGARALELLDGAQTSVDVAQYNIRSEVFYAKLEELRARGVRVRVVIDAKNARNPWNTLDDRLEAAGFDLVRYENTTSTYAIMHHKFSVIDGALVMTGSYNWNGTAQHVNDEAMLVLRDPALVRAYEREFAELRGAPEVSDPGLGAAGEVRFSPEDGTQQAVIAAIRGAQRRIRVAVFAFKERDVARELRDAARRGVEVTLLTEKKQADTTNADETVASGGARVIVAANTSSAFSAMHDKFAVIDDALVIAGACNWTWTAFTASNEDVLLLRDPALAQRFTEAFGALVLRYDPTGFAAADYGIQRAEAATHFAVTVPGTLPGDSVWIVGDHPALGMWDPDRGVPLGTSTSVFPTWGGRVNLPVGADVAWKTVVRRADGTVRWELGADRTLHTDPNGTSGLVTGSFRDLVDVRLSVRFALAPGAELRLVGDDPLLGSWDPASGLPFAADATDPDLLRADVPLPGRSVFGAKLVVVEASGDVTWEGGWDRALRIHDRDAPQPLDLGTFR